MPEKNQRFIFNSVELELIKNTFAENDELLYAIRNVLLQFPLTEGQKSLIRSGVTEAVYNVLKKRILPDLSPEFPLTQLPSILTTLTNDLKVKDVDEMGLQFAAKDLEIAYLEQQFAVLKNVDMVVEPKYVLAEMGQIGEDKYDTFVGMTAYLFLVGYVDPMLNFIKSIAGAKDETLEQQTERLSRDSSK